MTPSESEQRSAPERLTRPLLVFDGDCGFCRYWVARWRAATRGAVDFAPSQEAGPRFPQIPPEAFAHSVQLLTPEGQIFEGAEAVFRSLAYAPERRWMLSVYHHLPGARPVAEWGYRLVAAHRGFFSKLTRLAWGRQPERSSYILTRWLFLRLIGVVYLVAFLSLGVQIMGLVGSRGILPAGDLVEAIRNVYGWAGFRIAPTLTWWNASDAFLKFLADGGAVLAVLVILGIATGPVLVLLWVFYLSLVTVGRDFLSFQWDILLLEAGFLAILFASWRPLEAPWKRGASRPSPTVLWLGRWLLFRLVFLSGAVKLLSGDPTWRNLRALEYHYWTQPLPTPPAWYAAQLPVWFQKLSVVGVFASELVVPFLIFTPRRLRLIGALLITGFQLLIGFTGNYAFFNLLTIVLCVLLVDDAYWKRWLPHRLTERILAEWRARRVAPAGKLVRLALAAVILIVSGSEMLMDFRSEVPSFARNLVELQAPFFLANSYGLFAVMTTARLEIVVEGSNDGENWLAYEFKYKPGDLRRPPPWVEPHQPRLDWQMWFAALGSYRQNRWFLSFIARLLQGTPEVTALLEKNPFPSAPPRYVRASAYDYHFTDFVTRRATGEWWRREYRGLYLQPVSLRGP
jgi:lipase maturation factor 1